MLSKTLQYSFQLCNTSQAGEPLKLDSEWLRDSAMAEMAENVGAVLLRTDGKRGALRLRGSDISGGVKDFVTERTKDEYWLIVIADGQRLTCLGNPAIRILRRP